MCIPVSVLRVSDQRLENIGGIADPSQVPFHSHGQRSRCHMAGLLEAPAIWH